MSPIKRILLSLWVLLLSPIVITMAALALFVVKAFKAIKR